MDVLTPHLAELRVALTLDDPRRIMPAIPAGCRRVLDVGCGAGQTLIGSDLEPGVVACGADRDVAALQLGRQLTERVTFVCAAGGLLIGSLASRTLIPVTSRGIDTRRISESSKATVEDMS